MSDPQRPESGPMQFGDDWPGVFIRGDNAFYFAMNLELLLEETECADPMAIAVLKGLLSDLKGCDTRGKVAGLQKLKAFGECVTEPTEATNGNR